MGHGVHGVWGEGAWGAESMGARGMGCSGHGVQGEWSKWGAWGMGDGVHGTWGARGMGCTREWGAWGMGARNMKCMGQGCMGHECTGHGCTQHEVPGAWGVWGMGARSMGCMGQGIWGGVQGELATSRVFLAGREGRDDPGRGGTICKEPATRRKTERLSIFCCCCLFVPNHADCSGFRKHWFSGMEKLVFTICLAKG